jgi:hypothetical protein
VYELQERFSERRENMKDDEGPGRPVTLKTDENVENVRIIVSRDRRLGIRMTVEELNMGKTR